MTITLGEVLEQKALTRTVNLLREHSKEVLEILKEINKFD